MTSSTWWHTFIKHAKAISTVEKAPSSLSGNIDATLRLFHLLVETPEKLNAVGESKLNSLLLSAETLLHEIKQRERETGHPNKRSFYNSFAKAVYEGIEAIKASAQPGLKAPETKQAGKKQSQAEHKPYKATRFGKALVDLKRQYIELMEAQHQARKTKGLKETAADEADRLASFLKTTSFWLKHLQALEYAANTLQDNLNLETYPLEKKPLPLQFRLEPDSTPLTFRLIKASPKNPLPEDVSILDIINDCYAIPVFLKDGKQLVDDPEVIRFLRLHSEKDNLVVFKQDSLSQIAQQMYFALVNTINDIKRLFDNVVSLINRTPLQDLEYAFFDINPDECRSLLRKKFQSMLPGINERRYRQNSGREKDEPDIRAQETMEDYQRDFLALKEKIFGELKTTMATAYWLRRMVMATLRSNFLLEQKSKGRQTDNKGKASQATRTEDLDHVVVGISITIGDEDIAPFYINPDDVTTSQMSLQRADKADKWIAVRKSEKTHRLLKKDFFGVIKTFIDKDLNPALQRYGSREIDFNQQLLPEVHERLVDEQRIEAIRSAVLGTIITNLDEFRESSEFHSTLRQYFRKPDYDNIHYPEAEKMSLVARGLTHSSTSILQMKFRRVLKVKEEINHHLKQIKHALEHEPLSQVQTNDFQENFKQIKSLLTVLNKVQQIMIYARPSLKDVKLEPDSDYIVFRPGE